MAGRTLTPAAGWPRGLCRRRCSEIHVHRESSERWGLLLYPHSMWTWHMELNSPDWLETSLPFLMRCSRLGTIPRYPFDSLRFFFFFFAVLGQIKKASIKRHFLLGRKAMTNLDSILKSRDIANKGPSTQSCGFSSSHI